MKGIGRVAPVPLVAMLCVGAMSMSPSGAFARPDKKHPQVKTIEVRPGLLRRTARLYIPASLPTKKRVPLVLMLHGGFGDAKGAAKQSGFDRQAETGKFLVVYPQGVLRSFNAGGCCGPAMRDKVNDVAFISALLDKLESKYKINIDRVYATGMSNGAIMSYRLACELPDRFAAIAPVAGTLFVGCDSTTPVSVLHIHGVDDQNLPLNGGVGSKELQNPPIDAPPVQVGIDTFRKIDGCPDQPTTTKAGAVNTTTWSLCRSGTTVKLITVDGAGHQWPGGQQMAKILDKPTTALDATSVIWKFFKDHPKKH